MADVIVVGGGNAALCAALSAADEGVDVLLLERAPRPFRGGNTRHTRNIRAAHDQADDYVTGPYDPDEMYRDIVDVTQGGCDPDLTSLLVGESLALADWMWHRGIRWQKPLKGTLHLSRTNRFFLGGGKSLVNAYFETARKRGVEVRYEAEVIGLDIVDGWCRAVVLRSAEGIVRIGCRAVVVASGGFEANLDWMREYWGDAADNFIVRGTPLNDGRMLRRLFEYGAMPHGDPTRFHSVAVDARAPRFDGGIVTRLDMVPLGIVVNRDCRRFYDEGEDIWPKRYAIWGRLLAEQDGQTGFVIVDSRVVDLVMPPVFPPIVADTIPGIADQLGLDPVRLAATVAEYNAAVVDGRFDLAEPDECRTEGISPPKSHWALRLEVPPFHAFPLRPGITFTYHGVVVDRDARVRTDAGAFGNVFAAGEIMAGTILSQGYLAGLGLTIGSVFGRIAGRSAARV